MKKINIRILIQIIFLFLLSISLFLFVKSVKGYKEEMPNIKFECENGILKYIENEKYKRDIWVSSRFKINCKIENEKIIIKEGKQ